LIFSRERKLQKISPRHQSDAIVPCGVRRLNAALVNLDFTGFAGLHPRCLLDLKGKMRIWEHIEGVFWGKV